MTRKCALRLALAGLVLLASCGGGHQGTTSQPAWLALPNTALADPERCVAIPPRSGGLASFRQKGGQCWHSFEGLQPAPGDLSARKQILATAPTRLVTATELFDWAEREYPQYFPSRQVNRQLDPYVYRYYPESGNHAALAGDRIYVQGPVSGGGLLFVGTLEDYSCRASPTLCGETPRNCNLPASWAVLGNTCTPNAGQPSTLASGENFTLVDTVTPTTGSARYTCSDGSLSTVGTIACEVSAPLACNTASLSWTVGDNTCTSNAGDPTQLASGVTYTFTDSTGTSGTARYSCSNGTLAQHGSPTCEAPQPVNCSVTSPFRWTVDSLTCRADSVPDSVAHGSKFTFSDTDGDIVGSNVLQCNNGELQATETPARCVFEPHTTDSFGGDGGVADGGANGDGTAADGAPIVGGLVRVTDLNGKLVTATTDSQGYFRVKLTGMTPPLLVAVTRPDGKVRRSFSTQPLKINGYIFIAVTGLTDKLVSDMAQAAGFSGPGSLTPAMIVSIGSGINSIIEALRNDAIVRPQLVAAGIDPESFDPLTTPFRPDGRGYDAVLDNVVIDSDTSGNTIIKTADCQAPASWTVGNNTCTPDSGEETVVPNFTTVIHRDSVGLTRGTVGWTCLKGTIQSPILPTCTASGTGN